MNILMVGNGKAGSWQIRGVQLGAAIGARVTTSPVDADWRWADLVVLIKRWGSQFASTSHHYGLPIVWDALDFWGQPAQNALTETAARALLAQQIALIRPALVIGATEAMAKAAGGVYLPHHSWEGLTPTPAREHVQTVAYQGGEVFLGQWAPALRKACERRGWTFVVNPPDLRQADILVALRDGQWDGWMCREWKSGVKLVNAIAAGRPIIVQDSAARHEIPASCVTIGEVSALDSALDYWSDREMRVDAAEYWPERASPYRLASVAEQFRAILESVRATCTA